MGRGPAEDDRLVFDDEGLVIVKLTGDRDDTSPGNPCAPSDVGIESNDDDEGIEAEGRLDFMVEAVTAAW